MGEIPHPFLKGNVMHELSIVTYVIEQVEKIAKENELTDIQSVTLEFGEVSGIVPEYLSDCWQWYAKKTPLIEHAEFKYEIIPAITWCDDCKHISHRQIRQDLPALRQRQNVASAGAGNEYQADRSLLRRRYNGTV